MVQNVAQKQQTVGLLPVKGFQKLAAIESRAVDIRCDH
jgi:hypothetical protein